jgi:hypothetical protein
MLERHAGQDCSSSSTARHAMLKSIVEKNGDRPLGERPSLTFVLRMSQIQYFR